MNLLGFGLRVIDQGVFKNPKAPERLKATDHLVDQEPENEEVLEFYVVDEDALLNAIICMEEAMYRQIPIPAIDQYPVTLEVTFFFA